MQRVLAYLQHTSDRPLMLRPDSGTGVLLYSDASWSDCFSTSGGIIYVHGCAVLWYSRRQRTVSHSTAEAEYIAASMAAREGEYLRAVYAEMTRASFGPTPMLMDSKSAIRR